MSARRPDSRKTSCSPHAGTPGDFAVLEGIPPDGKKNRKKTAKRLEISEKRAKF
jgi:hypothetical protein